MICTGRFFAKQEIMAAVALLVLKFDMEELENWVTLDGKFSARPAKLADGYAGAGVSKSKSHTNLRVSTKTYLTVPPDRDIRLKMRRIR